MKITKDNLLKIQDEPIELFYQGTQLCQSRHDQIIKDANTFKLLDKQ